MSVTFTFALAPMLAIACGVAILVWPRFLNYIVALYLIVIGAVDLLNIH